MAQKRMFSLAVVDTDKFLDMSSSVQALYFHLGMHGDDDGFVSSPKKIARTAGCNDDDLRLLAAKGFVIPFDSGVIVITDWNINNTLKNDRYHETVYQEEKEKISTLPSGKYILGSSMVPEFIQDGSSVEPQHNVTQHNVTEPSKVGADKPPAPTRRKHGTYGWVRLTDDEYSKLVSDLGQAELDRCIQYIDESAQGNGNKNRWKDWNLVIRRCSREGWGRGRAQMEDKNRLRTESDYNAGNGDFFGGDS